jgi:hypothetical protein
MVWVASSTNSRTKFVFHTDPDCRYVHETHKQRVRASLNERFSECRVCAGECSPGSPERRSSLHELIAEGKVEVEG